MQEVEGEMKNKSHKNHTKETYGKIMKYSVTAENSLGEETVQSGQRLRYQWFNSRHPTGSAPL